MSVTYPYTLADFPNGLRTDQLKTTIINSTIGPTLLRIDQNGNDVFIVFASALSGPEQIQLDNIVNDHVPNNQTTLAGQIYQLDTISTTDATITTLATLTTSMDTVIYVHANVIAIQNTSTNDAGWSLNRTYKNDSGTLTAINGQDKLEFQTNSWDTNLSLSGSDITLNVQGAAATNISWKSTLQYTVHHF